MTAISASLLPHGLEIAPVRLQPTLEQKKKLWLYDARYVQSKKSLEFDMQES